MASRRRLAVEEVEVAGTMGTCTSMVVPEEGVEEAGRGVLSRRDRDRMELVVDRNITMTRRRRTGNVDRIMNTGIRWMGLEGKKVGLIVLRLGTKNKYLLKTCSQNSKMTAWKALVYFPATLKGYQLIRER